MDGIDVAIADNLVFLIIGSCFIVGMILKAITAIVGTNAREKSRREIAAYIAEGSMTPEHGERLLQADVRGGRSHVA